MKENNKESMNKEERLGFRIDPVLKDKLDWLTYYYRANNISETLRKIINDVYDAMTRKAKGRILPKFLEKNAKKAEESFREIRSALDAGYETCKSAGYHTWQKHHNSQGKPAVVRCSRCWTVKEAVNA